MATYGPHKLTRDKGLMSRMYLTMFLMGILYAAFVLILWSSGVGIIFVGIIAGVILAIQYFMSEKLVLRSTGAREVTREQEPELYAMVERLAETAGLPMPKLAIIDSPVPNAFATGRNPQHALVVVTTGIRQRLTDRELNAVLAHELAHVTNRDMRMMAIASFFVTVASFLMQMFMWRMMFGGMFGGHRGNQGGAIMGIFLVTILVYFIGSILMKSLSRYREFGADHGGAELTGDPGALASALEKISGSLARIPSDDLRKLSTANAFMIIPALRGDRMGKLLSTHPAVEDRVARLRAMEREMPTFLR
ncbi:MAG: zinc metalloprotease HtpX [Chloroflexi bacterium]|nr:zinc metalloprotease HtpX [Chloroflexota bacterium]MCH8221828.1 zinc metalloprotease HtpX [Chloroflexota bacterium]